MRKLTFLIAVIATFAMTSCSLSVKIPYRYSMSYIDYNTVSQQYGVFITESNSVGFDYQPIGSISLMERSGNEVKSSESEAKDGVYSKSLITTVKYGDWIDASIDELLKIACQKAIEQGGNGIINMKIEYLPST
ncbi:hypothetical protein H6A66_17045 [Bacteroides caecigallinarum]|uniref:hypothetical protein n=1 Tax=Bacteroides caecigallinarum TaxID=1411144 RepID=UPI00195AD7CD|nr:hypothetical protein [Bacteroides caecigallinarum]MBM6866841.1 hypothetical protein [Bacteroides caecigallinarum]